MFILPDGLRMLNAKPTAGFDFETILNPKCRVVHQMFNGLLYNAYLILSNFLFEKERILNKTNRLTLIHCGCHATLLNLSIYTHLIIYSNVLLFLTYYFCQFKLIDGVTTCLNWIYLIFQHTGFTTFWSFIFDRSISRLLKIENGDWFRI